MNKTLRIWDTNFDCQNLTNTVKVKGLLEKGKLKVYDIIFVNCTMYTVTDCMGCNTSQVATAYHKQLIFIYLNYELLITLIGNLPGMKRMPITVLFACNKVVRSGTKRKLSVVADSLS